MKSQEEV